MLPVHDELLKEFQDAGRAAPTAKSLMELISKRLHEKMARYNWAGFYLVDPKDPNILLIGPYVGSFSPNARIPLSSGLCGAAASTGETVLVQDVSKDSRYLAGSPLVKCEIVVPIFVRRSLAAELDIESYFTHTFTDMEKEFIEACAAVVQKYLEKN